MRPLSLITGLNASASLFLTPVASKFVDETCQQGLYVSLYPLSNDPWAQKFCSSIRQRTYTGVVTTTITDTTFSGAVATVTSTTLTTTTASTTAISTITTTTTSISTSTTISTTTSTSVSTETDTTTVSIISLGPPAKRSVGCQKTKAASHKIPTAPAFHGRPSHQSLYDAIPTSTYGGGFEYSPSDYQRPAASAQDAHIEPFNHASPEHPWDGSPHEEYSQGNAVAYGYSTPTEYTPSIPTNEGFGKPILFMLPVDRDIYDIHHNKHGGCDRDDLWDSHRNRDQHNQYHIDCRLHDYYNSHGAINHGGHQHGNYQHDDDDNNDRDIHIAKACHDRTYLTDIVQIIPVATDCPSLAPSYQAANGVVFNVQCNASYNGGTNEFATIPTENFRTCLDTCSITPGCAAIDFDELTTNCSLFSFLQGGQDSAPGIDQAVVIS